MELDRLYLGDCLELIKYIPDGSVDCIICDLPYGTTDCAWDCVIPIDALFAQYKRILKHNGNIVLFGSEPFSTIVRSSALDLYKYDWKWIKTTTTGFVHAKNMPLKNYEDIMVFSLGSIGHANLLGDRRMTYNPQGCVKVNKMSKMTKRKPGSVVGNRPSHKDVYLTENKDYPTMTLYFPKDTESWHPTQKPLDLIRYLVLTYTDENDVVLDNCMGSGTTAIACIREKRHYIGFEIDKKYYDIAKKRIDNERMTLTLF